MRQCLDLTHRLLRRRLAHLHSERGGERVRADAQAPDSDQRDAVVAAAGAVVQELRVLQGTDDPADGHGDGDAEADGRRVGGRL